MSFSASAVRLRAAAALVRDRRRRGMARDPAAWPVALARRARHLWRAAGGRCSCWRHSPIPSLVRGTAHAAARRRRRRGRRIRRAMNIGDRAAAASGAARRDRSSSARHRDLDVRVIHAGAPDRRPALADDGTRLFTALTRALADMPRQRLAGAIMITDGEVHDMPPPARLGFGAPLHALIVGMPGEARPAPGRFSKRRASVSSARR